MEKSPTVESTPNALISIADDDVRSSEDQLLSSSEPKLLAQIHMVMQDPHVVDALHCHLSNTSQ